MAIGTAAAIALGITAVTTAASFYQANEQRKEIGRAHV